MLRRTVGVAVDTKSWGRRTLPAWASGAASFQQIDVGRALLMLGSITTPNGLSPGSPERYWACIRYFTACTATRDLRIRTPFMDLDPHQKGILSDDFGVALATCWLETQLGGVREIVDGRRFSINMGILRSTRKLPKVGRRKCPDFVLEDMHGKFHVLECKGTQSGSGYLRRAMETGTIQKLGIKVATPLRGERLVIGVALAGEGDKTHTELVIQDPEDEPITEIGKDEADKAEEVMTRLSLARALNLTGFPQTGFEIAWPAGLHRESPEMEFLSEAERKALSRSVQDRSRAFQDEISSELKSAPHRVKHDYVTREVRFDLPPIELESGKVVTTVLCRRGFREDMLHELAQAGPRVREFAERRLKATLPAQERIAFVETSDSVRLDYGGYFFSEVEFGS